MVGAGSVMQKITTKTPIGKDNTLGLRIIQISNPQFKRFMSGDILKKQSQSTISNFNH